MPLIINGPGADTRTDRHTRILTHEPKQFQETRCVLPMAVHAWFKNRLLTKLNNDLLSVYVRVKGLFKSTLK